MNLDGISEAKLLEKVIPPHAVKELENRYTDVKTALLNTSIQELEQIKGIGNEKAQQIISIVTLAKRLYKNIYPPKQFIKSPEDAYLNYAYLQAKEVEEFHMVCLDVKNGIKMSQLISKGTTNASVVTSKEIFCTALRCLANGIILIHNHPSGYANPSEEDKKTTEELIKIGQLLKIKVHDHIIIGKGEYYSIRENQIELYERQIFL